MEHCPDCGYGNPETAKFCVRCGSTLSFTSASIAPAFGYTASTGKTDVRHAGFWLRVAASIIDGILCQIIIFIITLGLGFALGSYMASGREMGETSLAIASGVGGLAGLVIQWLWFTLSESSSWQATPGKKILGLRVTNMDGGPIGFGRANARYWSKIISALLMMIGFLMVAFTRKKQGLHDVIAGTLVIRG